MAFLSMRGLWLSAAISAAVLILFPQMDVAVSAWFYDEAGRFFPFRVHPLGEFARKVVPVLLFAAAGVTALLGAASWVRRRPLCGITHRHALLVVLSLALGPGLVVNVLLKDNWGRARPSTIERFAQPHQTPLRYTPPLVPSDQCVDNCSFPSGHAALGFWTVSFALLVPPRRRRAAMAAALAFGVGMGLVRIAQGGHFLSDVAASGLVVVGLTALLHRGLFGTAEKNNRNETPPAP